eukprot:COSAG05_NODE_10610_length_556_cov_0.680525_1_plen_163_part_01
MGDEAAQSFMLPSTAPEPEPEPAPEPEPEPEPNEEPLAALVPRAAPAAPETPALELARPPPMWLVRQTVRRPCCVCCTSICTAFALTCVMLGGLASGAFEFALDTSPASFKVKFDSIADRGDALLVFRRGSTSRSPRWVEEGTESDGGAPGGCQFGTCDTGDF